MKGAILVSILLGWSLLESQADSTRKYQHFEDFLSELDSLEQDQLFGLQNASPEIEGSGEVPEHATTSVITYLPPRTGLKRNKSETCCRLGTLAGDKGYHCLAELYHARILARNQNRAHNRKIVFGNNKIMNKSREKLMMTFEKCVAGKGMIFHKCCHRATLIFPDYDKKDTQQAKRYKEKMQQRKRFQRKQKMNKSECC